MCHIFFSIVDQCLDRKHTENRMAFGMRHTIFLSLFKDTYTTNYNYVLSLARTRQMFTYRKRKWKYFLVQKLRNNHLRLMRSLLKKCYFIVRSLCALFLWKRQLKFCITSKFIQISGKKTRKIQKEHICILLT